MFLPAQALRHRHLVAVISLALVGAATVPGPAASQARTVPLEGGTEHGGPASVSRTAFAMGTRLDVLIPEVYGRSDALEASEAVLREVARVEDLLSTWRKRSPLSQANRAPVHATTALPPELYSLLADALAWSGRTGGAFDPRIGALVDAWDLRGPGRVPEPRAVAEARAASGAGSVVLTEGGLVRTHPRAWIDAGGFGKGAALVRAREVLRNHGISSARLNFGGQLLLVGTPRGEGGGPGWQVPVAHPQRRDQAVATLRVRDASVATSGASQRGIEVDGRRFGHLLDPRSGMPVRDWGSVTVVSRDPFAADVLATALFVLGPGEALSMAGTLSDTGVLILVPTPEGVRARWNDAMTRWLEQSSDTFDLIDSIGADGAPTPDRYAP